MLIDGEKKIVLDGNNNNQILVWDNYNQTYSPTLTPTGLEGLIIGATAFPGAVGNEKNAIYAKTIVKTEKIGRGGNFECEQWGLDSGNSAGTGFYGNITVKGDNDFSHIYGTQAWVFCKGTGIIGRVAGSMATATIDAGQTVEQFIGFYFPGFGNSGTVLESWGLYLLSGGKSFMSGEVIMGPNTDPLINTHVGRGSRLTATDEFSIGGFGITSKPQIGVYSNNPGAIHVGGVLGLGGELVPYTSGNSNAENVANGGCVRLSNVVTVTTSADHNYVKGITINLEDVDTGAEADAFSGTHVVTSIISATEFTFDQDGEDESNLAAGISLRSLPYTHVNLVGSPATEVVGKFAGELSVYTTSSGTAVGEDNSGNYLRLRINPEGATFFQDLEVQGNVGFYATTPVAQNQLTTGSGKTVDNVITELQRLGLVRQGA